MVKRQETQDVLPFVMPKSLKNLYLWCGIVLFSLFASVITLIKNNIKPDVVAEVLQFSEIGGDAFLSGHWTELYSNQKNQSGPIQAPLDAILIRIDTLLPTSFHEVYWFTLQTFVLLAYYSFVVFVTKYLVVSKIKHTHSTVDKKQQILPRSKKILEYAPYLAMLFLTFSSSAGETLFWAGHWWQLVVLLSWIMTIKTSLEGKLFIPALWLILGFLFEPWAILGGLFVFFAPTFKKALIIGSISFFGFIMIWLPFVLQPNFALTNMQWKVREDSFWAIFITPWQPFGWPYRIIQTLFIIIILLFLIYFTKKMMKLYPDKTPMVIITVPLLLIIIRIFTDVWFLSYYISVINMILVPLVLTSLILWQKRTIFLFSAYAILSVGDALSVPWTCQAYKGSASWADYCENISPASFPAIFSIFLFAFIVFCLISIGLFTKDKPLLRAKNSESSQSQLPVL